GDDFPFPYIEDHKLVRIHVRDVQPRMSEIEALIIETNGWPGKRNVGDLLKRRWRFLSKCRSAKENRGSDQATDSRTGDLVAHKTTLPSMTTYWAACCLPRADWPLRATSCQPRGFHSWNPCHRVQSMS